MMCRPKKTATEGWIHSMALLSLLWVLTGCSATKQHVLSTLEPAPVDLATNITKIGIIDESDTSERSEYKTRLEQILYYRDQNLEKEGVNSAITGLFEELRKDRRFDTIKVIKATEIDHNGPSTPTATIPWGAMKGICDAHGIDALFSLAYYEADTHLSIKKTAIEEQNMLRQMVKVRGHKITLETLIENGWRIYDPYNQKVIDELVFNEQVIVKGQGTDLLYALDAVNDRRKAVLEQSTQAGSAYGKRLLPQEKELTRNYYIRGSEKLVRAKQYAADGNWQAAATLWEQETANEASKAQAKAYYNMAFYNEMRGNCEKALEWAKKAANLEGNKKATRYVNALKERMVQNKIVREQLERSHLSASVE